MATTNGCPPKTDAVGPEPAEAEPLAPSRRWSDPIVAALTAEFEGRLPARLVQGVIATYIACFAGTAEPSAATYTAIERASRAALACRVGALGAAPERAPSGAMT